MDIIYLIHALAKRKWIIFLSTLLALAGAFGYTFNQPKMYKSVAQLATGFTINSIGDVNDQSLNQYNVEVKFDNVVQNFTSPQVLGLLCDSLLLHDLTSPHPFRILDEKQLSTKDYQQIDLALTRKILSQKLDSLQILNSFNPTERSILHLLELYHYDQKSLIKKLYVYRVQNTDYIQIEFQSESPDLSAFVVNNLCTEFLRHYGYTSNIRAQEGINNLKAQMDQKKDTLDNKMARIRLSGGTIDETSEGYPELIQESERSLQEDVSDSTDASLKLRNLESEAAAMGSPVGTSPSQTNADIVKLKNQIDNLNAQYTDGGQKDEALAARIATLRRQYQDDLGTLDVPATNGSGTQTLSQVKQKIADYEVQLQVDRGRIRDELANLNDLQSGRQTSASKSAVAQAMQNELTIATADYTTAKGKYDAALEQQGEGSNFRQVLFGQPAVDPEPSKRLIIIGIAGITMFLLCTFVVIFLEYLDISLKTPFQFSKLIDLKLISSINDIDMRKGLLNIISQQAGENEKRENVFRELLRKLRYEIEHSGFKIILFTSTKSGVGKTTLVQALAYSLSLSKKRVLILDTNFCNNDLTVQLEAKPTLESISMEGDKSLDDELVNVLTPTAVPFVDAIGCRGGDYTPLEILPKHNLLGHLHELTKRYDYIFLEGAPLNDYSDTRELLGYVDGVVAIFSAKFSVNQVDKESIDFLKSLNGKLVGAILNKVELQDIEK